MNATVILVKIPALARTVITSTRASVLPDSVATAAKQVRIKRLVYVSTTSRTVLVMKVYVCIAFQGKPKQLTLVFIGALHSFHKIVTNMYVQSIIQYSQIART